MSVIPSSARMLTSVDETMEYLEHGRPGSQKSASHREHGTDRIAAMSNDCGTPEAFLAEAKRVSEQSGRKNLVLSFVQSHPSWELDKDDPDDIQRCCDAGYATAKKNWPGAKVCVITHADSEGGHLHNHILVINEEDGRALRHTRLDMIRAGNDEVMREMELSVLPPQGREGRELYAKEWEEVREQKAPFQQVLGDQVLSALNDKRSVDEETFREVLGESGVTIYETDQSNREQSPKRSRGEQFTGIGWSYRMFDETPGTKNRYRHANASRLTKDFTHESVMQTFALKRQIAELQQQKAQQQEQEQETYFDGTQRSTSSTARRRAAEQPATGASTATSGASTGEQPGDSHESALDIAKRVARERDAKKRRDERDGSAERADSGGRETERNSTPEPDSAGQRAGRKADESFFRRTPSRRQGRTRG